MKQVLKITDSVTDGKIIKASAYICLSNNYETFKDYENVLFYANKAKIIGEQTHNESVLSTAYNAMSDTYISKKEYKKAITTSLASLKLKYLQKSTKKRASALLNAGHGYFGINELDKAILYFNEAKQIAKDKELLEIQMYSHKYLAKIYELKGDFETSYTEQKLYTQTKDFIQRDKKDAAVVDLNNEISKRDNEIKKTKQTLLFTIKNKKQLIIWGSIFCAVLLIVLAFYIKQKRIIQKQEHKLKAQYAILEQSFETLETKSKENVLSISKDHKPKLSAYKNSSLTEAKRIEYKEHILSYMQQEKPYLDGSISQSELAKKLNLSTHHFSEILNFTFEQNFYNFINSYRVLEAKNLIKNPEYKDAKMIAITFDSGFKSKTSFNRVFKIYTGLTPSQYRQKYA
ncbi:helix-turn-helix domain-containing protein [uncultured Algibacter sp.]|uniref:helix-turn-helix domain-containing protein n=1 Tax=uncultured Algibacter sp. TaxID=298659 RepID=UPI00321793CA